MDFVMFQGHGGYTHNNVRASERLVGIHLPMRYIDGLDGPNEKASILTPHEYPFYIHG